MGIGGFGGSTQAEVGASTLDWHVFDYFVQITVGKGHLTRMQAVLKAYVEAKKGV